MFNHPISPRNPLLVAELFHCVLECLAISHPQGPGKEEQRALAALARTCRVFSEPSLNHLWRRLDSLLPLMRCFSNVVDEDRAKVPPSPLEWLVINRYSHRIRELTLGTEYLSLHFLQHTQLVLSNLRVFRWKCPSTCATITGRWIQFPFDSITFLWPLLTPKIVSLEVTMADADDPLFQLFLESCPLLCPNLKSIKFDFFWKSPVPVTAAQALSRAICGHADWQRVELCPPIDNVVLKHLGMSSTLKTVSLALTPETSRPDEPCFGPADTPFRSVTGLALTLWNRLDFVTRLLRPRDQMFHCFELTLHTRTAVAEVSALFMAIASPQRIHSLQSITVRHAPSVVFGIVIPASEIRGNLVRQHLTYETFRPLVCLVYLSELVVNLDHPISFNDEEFTGLVRNWPLLEVLQLMWTCGENAAESITLRGFLSLLASCRRLRDIGLSLDAREVPEEDYVNICSSSVTRLTLQDSPIKDPDMVAGFLLIYLPSVPFVNTAFNRWPSATVKLHGYLQLWSQVNKYMAISRRPPFREWLLETSRFQQLRRFWHCLRHSGDGRFSYSIPPIVSPS